MGNRFGKTLIWIGIGLTASVLIAAGLVLGWKGGLPVQVLNHYSLEAMQEEALVMNECRECHLGEDFHRCSTCHDEHGAVEFAGLPFYNLISFTGDVPQPGILEVNQVLPYQDHPNTHQSLLAFIADQGVDDFESVTITSRDGGFVTIRRENISEQALLLPFADGIRFAAEDLHVSTWVKGITGLIVVGGEENLIIDGETTSQGRLMLGPTRQVIVEQARVMFASEEDGRIREAETAAAMWGAAVDDLAPPDYSSLLIRDQDGAEYRLNPDQAKLAVLVPDSGGPILVIPGESRSGWVSAVRELEWEE